MKKLLLIDPETDQIVQVIGNVNKLEIGERTEDGLDATWDGGLVRGLKVDLVVVNQEDFPDLEEEIKKRPVPQGVRGQDQSANFKKVALQSLQAEIAALRAEVNALKGNTAGTNTAAGKGQGTS